MKKVLITGGAGFIGSHLCEAYLSAGYQVGVVDDFSTGSRKNMPSQVAVYKANITNKKKLSHVFQHFKPDIVNHHAAQTKVHISNQNPELDASVNIIGLLNVLTEAKLHGVKQFIFASSGGTVYGDTGKLPLKETDRLLPESGYGISKTAGEHYVNLFAQQGHFLATIFRYANVFFLFANSNRLIMLISAIQVLISTKSSYFG